MLRLCKILIHDSSHRFLYPILSKRSKGALHPFWHWEQTSTVLTLQWKMQFVPGFLHWPSLIGHVFLETRNTKRNVTRLTGIENRKINSESIIICDESFPFLLCTPSIPNTLFRLPATQVCLCRFFSIIYTVTNRERN